MESTTLKASPRELSGKGPARRLRAEGKIPSVAYGGKSDTLNLAIDHDALKDILLSPRGRNTVITLDVEGGAQHQVMVKDYTVHPVSRRLLHADFMTLDESKPVVVEVPFVTTGKSKGVGAGGTLLVNVRSLRLKCLPKAIPAHIEHDVTELEINDVVKVRDLSLPEGTESIEPAERKILIVAPPRVMDAAAAEGEAAAGEAGDKAEEKKAD